MGLETGIDTNICAIDDQSFKIFYNVENLSPELRNPLNKNFSAKNIHTVHDIIRYLHQKSIDAMFYNNFEDTNAQK